MILFTQWGTKYGTHRPVAQLSSRIVPYFILFYLFYLFYLIFVPIAFTIIDYSCTCICHTETARINSLFAKYKIPVCHIIWGHTRIGAMFGSVMFNSLYLLTCKSYGKFQNAKLITHAQSANPKQW